MWWSTTLVCATIFVGFGLYGCSIDAQSVDATIVFVTSSTSQEVYGLSKLGDIPKNSKFVANRKTVLYIHGYVESLAKSTTRSIINAYIQEVSYNLLVLDWSTLAGGSYPSAVANCSELGPKIADAMVNLFNIGSITDIHIVGHSLGAHLGGYIGRNIIKKSSGAFKLQRLSGLDPAYPLYYPPIFGSQHIGSSDATFVDIIHTDAGGYGAPTATGSVDFWVNGGRRFQPGCPVGLFTFLSETDLCSHHRSVQLWAESVPAQSSSSSTFTASLKRNRSIKSQMGVHCSIDSVHGSYTIQT